MVVDSKILSRRNIMDERSVVSLCPSVSLCLRVSCIQNLGIFRTLTYSEPWHIQNPRYIGNPVKHLQRNVLQKQSTAIIIFANYNYFRNISFSRSVNIICFFKYFTPKVFILCKKVLRQSGAGVVSFDISEESVWDILSDKYKIFMTFQTCRLHFLQ